MLRVFLNDIEQTLDSAPVTWGNLLTHLEHAAAARGEVVSAIRFDDVENPAFQEAGQLERTLDGIDAVHVETATPAHLLATALEQGAAAAATLAAAARATSAAFRGYDIGDAHHRLAELSTGTHTLLAVLGIGTQVAGAGLEATSWDGRPVSARLDDLAGLLAGMVEAQEQQDWLTLADLLEYEFAPPLDTVAPVFGELRAAIGPGMQSSGRAD